MGFFDKFRKKETPVQENTNEVELGEKELEKEEGGYPNRKVWLEFQIEKLQKEIDSGTLKPEQVYQNKVIMSKYQEELDGYNRTRM